ncbi:MAG: hypothetical protein LiPW41_784 [Parcubacteria group bacterium LiPW_41]|nr:MAG: hypothetical protein LiPW41_784 [Parcubacteria group bacterium LiPW_41]
MEVGLWIAFFGLFLYLAIGLGISELWYRKKLFKKISRGEMFISTKKLERTLFYMWFFWIGMFPYKYYKLT